MHLTTERFWKCFDKLPQPTQKLARGNFNLLNTNPGHPSLHLKKIGKFWSCRVGLNYRALSVKEDEDFLWVWIGTHDEYKRMLKENS